MHPKVNNDKEASRQVLMFAIVFVFAVVVVLATGKRFVHKKSSHLIILGPEAGKYVVEPAVLEVASKRQNVRDITRKFPAVPSNPGTRQGVSL